MSYLLLNEKENILINKIGENIFLRNYSAGNHTKAVILGKSKHNEYTCVMGLDKTIHLVYKNNQNSLIYIHGKNGSFHTETLLSDLENRYHLCNLHIVSHTDTYVFYCAKNPNEEEYDLIFHRLLVENASPQSILTLPSSKTPYHCDIYENKIHLLTSIKNNKTYELNFYTFQLSTNEWIGYDSLVISEYPISDYSFCIKERKIYLIYGIDKYGYMDTYYRQFHTLLSVIDGRLDTSSAENSHEKDAKLIVSNGSSITSKIFIYNNILWINYKIKNALYGCFSYDDGITFTEPKKCTLQNDSMLEFTLTPSPKNLYGSEFFGFINHQPNIAILSQIDLDQILFNSTSNIELKEIISNSQLTTKQNTYIKELEEEIALLHLNQEKIINQYNELRAFTKTVQKEGKKWRKKYSSANSKLNPPIDKDKEIKEKDVMKKINLSTEDSIKP